MLKKDLWSKFCLGPKIWPSRQAQSGIRSKVHSWSTIQCIFKIRESARFTTKLHDLCPFYWQIRRSKNLFTPLVMSHSLSGNDNALGSEFKFSVVSQVGLQWAFPECNFKNSHAVFHLPRISVRVLAWFRGTKGASWKRESPAKKIRFAVAALISPVFAN